MRMDTDSIARFYSGPAGQWAMRQICRHLAGRWPHLEQTDSLCFGFGPDNALWPEGARMIRALPGRPLTPVIANTRNPVQTEEYRLPFPDNHFQRLLVMHGLEEAPIPARLIRELWRIAAPESRLLIVVAHRAGLWAWSESTPFGHGRPWSRYQLQQLLETALFEPVYSKTLLYAPPGSVRFLPSLASGWERLAGLGFPHFGGVLLMEALKRVEAPTSRGQTKHLASPVGSVIAGRGYGA